MPNSFTASELEIMIQWKIPLTDNEGINYKYNSHQVVWINNDRRNHIKVIFTSHLVWKWPPRPWK